MGLLRISGGRGRDFPLLFTIFRRSELRRTHVGTGNGQSGTGLTLPDERECPKDHWRTGTNGYAWLRRVADASVPGRWALANWSCGPCPRSFEMSLLT